MLTKEKIQAEVEKLVLDITGADFVAPDVHFVDDLTFDSLDELELAMKVETLFDIPVPDDILSMGANPQLVTVKSMADYIYEELSKVKA